MRTNRKGPFVTITVAEWVAMQGQIEKGQAVVDAAEKIRAAWIHHLNAQELVDALAAWKGTK
jgi:hypothetical protein